MSAVFAASGHTVLGFDEPERIAELERRELPVEEPGLRRLIEEQSDTGRLQYTGRVEDLGACQIVWIAYDTPIREDGTADAPWVLDTVASLFTHLAVGALVVVSSQVPVGSIASLERRAAETCPERRLRFASSPENLRLGRAIEYMRHPDRYVVGVRNKRDADGLKEAFAPISTSVEIMSVESAEMTKHALNAFLATSVSFINELAALCERTGADAREVERGLKTDIRVGSRAYLRAGGAYAGATLARDVDFIIAAEERVGLEPTMFRGVRTANDYHGTWSQRAFSENVGSPRGARVALLGLTYKPGTNTLRGSNSVALAKWFADQGATVVAFDPAVHEVPSDLQDVLTLAPSAQEALHGADAAFVMTQWPEFHELTPDVIVAALRGANVFDAERFLEDRLASESRLRYFAIGMSRQSRVAAP